MYVRYIKTSLKK